MYRLVFSGYNAEIYKPAVVDVTDYLRKLLVLTRSVSNLRGSSLRRSLSPVFVRIAGRWCPPWSTH